MHVIAPDKVERLVKISVSEQLYTIIACFALDTAEVDRVSCAGLDALDEVCIDRRLVLVGPVLRHDGFNLHAVELGADGAYVIEMGKLSFVGLQERGGL